MRVGVVGGATAGAATALLLARDGHEVTVFERVPEPGAVGAGILLQPLGQRVLGSLGLAEALAARSSPVRAIDARTRSGRRVLDFGYRAVDPDAIGWGVHRGVLFDLLWGALAPAGVATETGVDVHGASLVDGRWVLATASGARGPFDLLVGADGARSRLRRWSGLATKDAGYPYGAIWALVPDPDLFAGDVLRQTYDGTRITLGVLPTGVAEASLFWLIPSKRIEATLAAGAEAWVRRAAPYAGRLRPLIERAVESGILGARYRDVVVRSPIRVVGDAGIALVGDAAHAMSPQLGLGASLALADAWSLAAALRAHPGRLGEALAEHARARAAHVRYYTWCSRLMTPVFQSDLVPIGWARDALFGPVGRIPWVRRQFVTTLMGIRTSPWTLLRTGPTGE
jgi:2-polyprenyl-6-methoxyphenol hydroxylase-like FAD-dependent oxidoreductase